MSFFPRWSTRSRPQTGFFCVALSATLRSGSTCLTDGSAARRRAWEAAGGKVEAMTSLGSGGEETHWLLRKP